MLTKVGVVFLLTNCFVQSQSASPNVCTTPTCHQLASDIFNSIDSSVNPCDNFYKFACGALFKNASQGTRRSPDKIMDDITNKQMEVMLTEAIKPSDPRAVQGIKKFFKSCMDEARIEANGINSLKAILRQLGGWPILEGAHWNGNNFELGELLVKLRKMGLKYDQILSVLVGLDEYVVISEPIVWTFPEIENKTLHKFILDTVDFLGADVQQASTEVDDIIQFKIDLSNIAALEESYKPGKTHFKNIREEFHSIDLMSLFNTIREPHEKLSENDEVYLPTSEFFSNLEKLLNKTTSRTIANFVIWEAIQEVVPYLPKAFRELKSQFVGTSAQEAKPRHEVCVEAAQEILPPTFETLYMTKYFPQRKRNSIEDIVKLVNEEFIQLLNETDLYDDVTRAKAIKKAKAIKCIVGGPDELFQPEILEELFYDKVNLNSEDFLTLAVSLNRQRVNYKLKINATMREEYAVYTNVNGQYDGLSNSVVLSAPLLQSKYFDEAWPNFMNFGALGMTIGHELTHAFSKLQNEDDRIWTKTVEEGFGKRSECLIQEANKFEIEGTKSHMDGERVLEETMGDHNGAEVAQRAYENWVRTYGAEKQLPRLNYTPKQLFWISAVTPFCDTIEPAKLEEFVQSNLHAHPEFRIISAMRNNGQFGHDFDCPSGSRMNPVEKCNVF